MSNPYEKPKRGPVDKPITGKDARDLSAEIEADTHAARVRDYGAEDAATYAQRVREGADMPLTDFPDAANPPYRERKPPNHGTYQVWHEGKVHAVNIESTNVRAVDELTKQPSEHWNDRPDVAVLVDNPRSTELGDVIVDPTCGAWEVREDGYYIVNPPATIAERIAREGIEPEQMQLLQAWIKDVLEADDSHLYEPGIDAATLVPAKESLIRETYRLNYEIGYAGFRQEYFDDVDAGREWLDPECRGELGTFWDAQGDYAAYRRDVADVGTDQLAEYRDYLRGLLAGGKDGQVAYYNRAFDEGWDIRPSESGFSEVGAVVTGKSTDQSEYQKALDAAADRGSNDSKRKDGPER
jgi:hypothetical protein